MRRININLDRYVDDYIDNIAQRHELIRGFWMLVRDFASDYGISLESIIDNDRSATQLLEGYIDQLVNIAERVSQVGYRQIHDKPVPDHPPLIGELNITQLVYKLRQPRSEKMLDQTLESIRAYGQRGIDQDAQEARHLADKHDYDPAKFNSVFGEESE